MYIKCCYYDVSQLCSPQLFEKALCSLAWKQRAEKVKSYRFDKDKRLCLGAGLLVQHMLLQAGVSDMQICETELGKPYLSNHSDIHLSISHDGTIALCALADTQVGADVQKTTAYNTRLASRVFTPDEIEWTENSPDRDKAFTRLWTRKESYVKMLGKGLSLDTRTISLCPENSTAVCFNEFDIGDYHISICTAQSVKAELSQWSFDM